MRPIRVVGKIIGIMMVIALASLAFGYFVMALWNWLIPSIFHGVGMITFWQAVGLLVLAKILFRGGGGGHWRNHHGWGHQGGKWGDWKNKWQNMTPEERDEMRSQWKGGWHAWRHKWHDMSPEEREKMKTQWKDRCSRWERSSSHPVDAMMHEDENAPRKEA